mgnify:CR=1 FL=1
MENTQKKLMQPSEVCRLFNITKPTEIRWRNEGKLPEPIAMGRRLYYSADKINQLIQS